MKKKILIFFFKMFQTPKISGHACVIEKTSLSHIKE